jgi:hypothetical protein
MLRLDDIVVSKRRLVDAPILIYPTNEAEDVVRNPKLTWSVTLPDAGYQLQVRPESQPDHFIIDTLVPLATHFYIGDPLDEK